MIFEANTEAGGLGINVIFNIASKRAVFCRKIPAEGIPLERPVETPPSTNASARLNGIVGGRS